MPKLFGNVLNDLPTDMQDGKCTGECSLEIPHRLGARLERLHQFREVLGHREQFLTGLGREYLPESILDRLDDPHQSIECGCDPFDQLRSSTELSPLDQNGVERPKGLADEGRDERRELGERLLRLVEVAEYVLEDG